ncbi:hypothetical protein GE09DRAFT_667627 [Coniochaeta sp. 2T2.1]|nr:hypothetical protein GE09DRAFT_667627 [Coniochaeta sp. 2T2.1]
MSSSTSKHKRKRKNSAHLPPETINPHSHLPNLLKQFRAAGLPESERLPSVPDFPHRPLPRNYTIANPNYDSSAHSSEVDDDDDETGPDATTDADSTDGELDPEAKKRRAAETRLRGVKRERRERERNIGVLVGILRRCVEEGDMPRARRAFGLLIRAKVDGRAVDLRAEGFWGLGAEILMRSGDGQGGHGGEEGRQDGETAKEKKRRWGSVQNMVLVRRFFEDLIQLYPYNRLHPDSVSALDFYPVLFSCEMYNVHVELEMALEKLDQDREEEEEDNSEMQADDDEARERRTKAARDELRIAALEVMRGVASRMDELMMVVPYSKSLEMLRLRGMIALFMGDLEVPAPPRGAYEEDEGHTKRETERERAVGLFKKVLAAGGELEPWIRRLVAEHDGEDDEESEDEEMAFILPKFSSLPIR